MLENGEMVWIKKADVKGVRFGNYPYVFMLKLWTKILMFDEKGAR